MTQKITRFVIQTPKKNIFGQRITVNVMRAYVHETGQLRYSLNDDDADWCLPHIHRDAKMNYWGAQFDSMESNYDSDDPNDPTVLVYFKCPVDMDAL